MGKSDWLQLPSELLFDIIDRLSFVDDCVRFGAACVSWRALFVEYRNKHRPQQLLAAMSEDVRLDRLVMYNFSKDAFLDIDSHQTFEGRKFLMGSSFGWLVTCQKYEYQIKVELKNPFLRRNQIINLPPLDRTTGYCSRYDNIRKAVLSSDPLLSDQFAVVAIPNNISGLIFFKSGNNSWTLIGEGEVLEDVLFMQRTKQFYALRETGRVYALDLNSGADPRLVRITPPADLSVNGPSYVTNNNWVGMYLVEDLPSGELLQVHQLVQVHPKTFNALHFDVFKLDCAEQKWIPIYNLGDKIMFLGRNSSVIRSARDCPGFKSNCIYFACHRKGHGIYSLEEKKYLPLTWTKRNTDSHIWIHRTLV